MITHWNFLLGMGLMLMLSPVLARPEPYQSELNPKAEIPGDVLLYNDLVDEVRKLHNQEINYLQYLGAMSIRQQREEDLLRQKQQELQFGTAGAGTAEEIVTSNLDELLVESPMKTLNRLHTTQLPFQKAKDEKKSNHYMSLCHFKLCNMGRKRNTRFLHFGK